MKKITCLRFLMVMLCCSIAVSAIANQMYIMVDKAELHSEPDINSPIVCGVGVDYGKTVITKIGIENVFDVKAFGDCINKASKYSKVSNSVKVSKKVKEHWPKGPNGKIVFKADEDGYLLTSK